ncbi:hypothetical protein ACFX14_018671 [Malus domestica]
MQTKKIYKCASSKYKGAFIDQIAPHHSAKLQEEEASEVDCLEPQHLVELRRTKAVDAFGVKPQTSDGHSESDLQIPAAGRAFFSCSLSNYWQACATLCFHA